MTNILEILKICIEKCVVGENDLRDKSQLYKVKVIYNNMI